MNGNYASGGFKDAAEGVKFQYEWSYAIHLLGHIYNNDINSARFLWKKVPSSMKEARPRVVAVWRIRQKRWIRDYVNVHEAIYEFSCSPEVKAISFAELYKKGMFELLLSAYSIISTQDSAHFQAMNESNVTKYVLL